MKIIQPNPFDKWATQYENDIIKLQNDYPFAGYFDIIESIEKTIKQYKSPSILDLGIGSGFMINKLKSKVDFEIVGMDSSMEMLALAGHVVDKESLIFWDVSHKNIPNQLSNQAFDILLSTFTLHHFDDKGKLEIIKKYMNSIAKNGVFIIADICFDNKTALETVKNDVGNRWDNEEGDYYFQTNVFLELLKPLYKIEHQKISFCTGIFKIEQLDVL